MSYVLTLASIDRAGDHAVVLGVLVVAAAVGGLVYGLVRFAGKSRARSARSPESDRGPDA